MKPRMSWGSFHLTAEDIKSFRSKNESARAIGKRKGGVASSLVVYHLRKLNDPEIDALLVLNANRASDDFKSNRLEKVRKMILKGRPSHEIISECHVSSSTLTRVRRDMGLSDPRLAGKKPKTVTVPGQPISEIKSLLCDVIDTNVFRILTKKWPIELEQPTEQAATLNLFRDWGCITPALNLSDRTLAMRVDMAVPRGDASNELV